LSKISFWTSYWGLAADPFSEEPLHYNTANFERLLVRYAPIEEVDEIIAKLYQEKEHLLRRKYYVIGLRGMGKTTILNYVVRKILEEPSGRILPIYVNNVHVKDPGDPIDPAKDSEKLRLNFCLRTIEALFNTVLHIFKGYTSECSSIEKARAKYYELKGKILIDQSTAEALLKEYLNRLKKDFDLFLLLYDELDKVDDYNIVLKFLRSSQGLLETLSEYGCVLFVCGVPDFSKMLHSSEYSGVSGHEIWIRPWALQDARTLIKSRLDYALFSDKFPFEDKVIEVICSKAEGRPRLVQSQARDALIWGAYSGAKRIDEKFLGSFMWKDNSILRFRADIQSLKELQEGVNILKKVYDPDRDDPSIYFLMMKIFEVGRIFSLSTDLREKYGIDMEADRFERLVYLLKDFDAVNERQTSGKKYYVLNNKLQNLFSYVKNALKESLEYLPRAIKVELGEVRESKMEFNLRNEITKILVTNPHHRYRRSDLVKEIMNNPDAKIRALEHYKVASEKELKSKLMAAIATVMRTLQKEGVVIQVFRGNRISYQFSEALEEIGWAKNLLLDEDVLQNYQSAINTLKEGNLSEVIPLLRLAVENTLRHLAKVYQIELPDKVKFDTLAPINEMMYRAKVYDQGLKAMIDAFNIEVGPICHGTVKLEDAERAKNLLERAQMIIRKLYIIKKERVKS
jgi:Cdc6-like AAA superfamily ATPase